LKNDRIAVEATAMLNRILAQAGLLSQQPNMRYWEVNRKDAYKFCWTTERCSDGKFYAITYRVRKDGTWILKKKVAFGKRRVAKKRAYNWMLKRKRLT